MKAERKVFGRLQNTYDPPDLIEIQTKSYKEFLQEDVPPATRARQGLEAIFHEIFPIASYDGRYVLDFVKYFLGRPSGRTSRRSTRARRTPSRCTPRSASRTARTSTRRTCSWATFP